LSAIARRATAEALAKTGARLLSLTLGPNDILLADFEADSYGGWGHIMTDQFFLSNTPATK
jgi:hypothetical protein